MALGLCSERVPHARSENTGHSARASLSTPLPPPGNSLVALPQPLVWHLSSPLRRLRVRVRLRLYKPGESSGHGSLHQHSTQHTSNTEILSFLSSSLRSSTSIMSDKCANCDCADKSQCTKKSDSYGVVIVDTESRVERQVAESAGENDGCNCGADCKCGSDCKCGK